MDLVKVAFIVCCAVIMCACGQTPSTESNADQDAEWLFELLTPYEGEGAREEGKNRALIISEVKKSSNVVRLIRIVRGSVDSDLSSGELPAPVTRRAIMLLGWVGTDKAVVAISPYLRHQRYEIRFEVADALGQSRNPKAISYLVASLKEWEKRLPAKLDGADIADQVFTLSAYVEALASIGTDKALAAVDACLTRLRNKYGSSEMADEVYRILRQAKNSKRL